MKTVTIILASGDSQSFGQPKQLLPFLGATLLRRTVEAALESEASDCVVVVGHEADQCAAEVMGPRVHVEFNPAWQQGLPSCIRAGVRAAYRRHPDLKAILLAPSDQPFLTPGLLDVLMETHQETARGIVACEYEDTAGIPAVFSSWWIDQLANLKDAEAMKQVIASAGGDLITVPFPEGALNVDMVMDFAAVLASGRQGTGRGAR